MRSLRCRIQTSICANVDASLAWQQPNERESVFKLYERRHQSIKDSSPGEIRSLQNGMIEKSEWIDIHHYTVDAARRNTEDNWWFWRQMENSLIQ